MSIRGFFLGLTVGALGFCLSGWGAEFVRVAYDDTGPDDARQPHLAAAEGPWRFNTSGTSDEALRTVAFGRRVEFFYRGLNPRAAYQAKMRFFSDGPRVLRIGFADATATGPIHLESGKVTERKIEIPPAAYAAGTLVLAVERVSGPNAVVSDVEIFSTDPQALEAIPVPVAEEPSPLPRLSPRPVRVERVSADTVDLIGTWQFSPAPPANFWVENPADLKSAPGWEAIRVPGEWTMQGFEVETNAAVGYRRAFAVPADWIGKRVKLRCEGVYSEAAVWINGKEAGRHAGGFTPFEFRSVEKGAARLPLDGPHLMLLPLNKTGENQMHGKTKVWTPFTEPCAGWVCEVFSWERRGYWDVYPEDHIARLKGTVRASDGFEATSVGPRTEPTHPWRLDNLPYGNNDFCSTKHNVVRATLTDAEGQGVAVDGHGGQHVRCWRTDAAAFFLVADYSNGGSERFLGKFTKGEERSLKIGDRIEGSAKLSVLLRE